MASRIGRAPAPAGPAVSILAVHASTGTAFTALAASPTVTDLHAGCKIRQDTRTWRRWRGSMVMASGTVATARAGFQYSLDNGSTWKWMDGTDGSAPAASPDAVMSMAASVVVLRSTVLTVPTEVQNSPDTIIRFAAYGGNGAVSPSVRAAQLLIEAIEV